MACSENAVLIGIIEADLSFLTVTVVCVCLGVNLLVGTENGLWLLDRSGQGKVYSLISRRRFQQMDVLEGLNVLITISGTYSTQSTLLQQRVFLYLH